MNILPKKRWHVRTKDNIARVRKDEAAAREEERKRQEKLELAESEARINFLRKKSGLPEVQSTQVAEAKEGPSDTNTPQHVDLFSDFKSHIKTTNKDLEREQKEEREKYEKQIGYLTYLGQDTNEALKLRSWYEIAPKRGQLNDLTVINEKDTKNKHLQDPLTLINALLPSEKAKPKAVKRKRSPSPVIPIDHSPKETNISSEKRSKIVKKHKKDKKHKKYKKTKKNKKDKERKMDKKTQDEAEIKREKLDKLRRERLKREAAERVRQEALLAPKEPAIEPKDTKADTSNTPRIVQKYNSQFNPELAKQNML